MPVVESFVVGEVVVPDLHVAVEDVNGATLLSRVVCKQVTYDRRAA